METSTLWKRNVIPAIPNMSTPLNNLSSHSFSRLNSYVLGKSYQRTSRACSLRLPENGALTPCFSQRTGRPYS